ncbi:MAG: type I secretion C-terminal target domain-containing protein [Leptolyngbyaceae cyanobacterium]
MARFLRIKGDGADIFRFNRSSLRDEKADVITDFEVGVDQIDFERLQRAKRYESDNFFEEFIRIKGSSKRTQVQIDIDGSGDGQEFKTLVVLKGVNANTVDIDSFIL